MKLTGEVTGNVRSVKIVAKELNRIAKANEGELTPEAVLESARSEKSPLHSHFTWDDTEAAEKLRLIEAQLLIRMVRVKVEMPGREQPVAVRAFVNVKPADVNSDSEAYKVYVPLGRALESDNYREQMLANAASDLASFKRKYAVLKELSEVFEAADKFTATVK
jgi:hypothetical protein